MVSTHTKRHTHSSSATGQKDSYPTSGHVPVRRADLFHRVDPRLQETVVGVLPRSRRIRSANDPEA